MPRVLCAALFCAMLAAIAVAWARPSVGADPASHTGYGSLRQPETGAACCSLADCRPTDYRLANGGYEVLFDQKWVLVPEKRVLRHLSGPVGRAIVCRTPTSDAIL